MNCTAIIMMKSIFDRQASEARRLGNDRAKERTTDRPTDHQQTNQ